MELQLSTRVQAIKPSPTLAVTAKAAELKAQGKDIISLGTGEPDFDTPEHIKAAAIQAIQDGYTKYTPVDGLPSLKAAIQAKFKRDNGLDYEANQILVSCGGKQSFFNLAQAYLNPGDEVIIPAPYWVSYPDMVILAGAKPVIVSAGVEQDFKITPQQLADAITPKTRLFVINSPSNPTGVCYSRDELNALAEVLLQHPHVLIATDDMYEHILWDEGGFHNIVSVCPALYDRTVVLNGVSKAYAMTGWRIGYAGGPTSIITAMKKIQSQSTSNPAAVSQKAAEAALNGSQEPVRTMLMAFKERHDHVYAALQDIPGIRVSPAQGTFYIFPNIQGIIDNMPTIDNDVAFAAHLLETVGLALVPGSAFGAPGCVRLSFATGMDTLNDALDRFKRAIG